MANLAAIRKRIASVTSTRQITSTMEMVARTKIHRAQGRVERAEPYAKAMRALLSNLADKYAEPVPLATPHDEIRRSLVILIGSDRGLAGHFNHDIIRRGESLINSLRAEGKEVDLILCGKVLINYFTYRNEKPVLAFRDLSEKPHVDESNTIAEYLVNQYLDNKIDEVFALYNHHRKQSIEQIPVQWRLMPIDMTIFENQRVQIGRQGISERDPRLKNLEGPINYEPSREFVLERLLPEYLSGYLYYMLINSAAGEQVSRQAAMKNATDNADDILHDLHLLYNHVRQDAITTEINEIVGGAEGLTDVDDRRSRRMQ